MPGRTIGTLRPSRVALAANDGTSAIHGPDVGQPSGGVFVSWKRSLKYSGCLGRCSGPVRNGHCSPRASTGYLNPRGHSISRRALTPP